MIVMTACPIQCPSGTPTVLLSQNALSRGVDAVSTEAARWHRTDGFILVGRQHYLPVLSQAPRQKIQPSPNSPLSSVCDAALGRIGATVAATTPAVDSETGHEHPSANHDGLRREVTCLTAEHQRDHTGEDNHKCVHANGAVEPVQSPRTCRSTEPIPRLSTKRMNVGHE